MSKSDVSSTEQSWVLAVLLAWAVPGLGHWYLGRRGKGITFFALIVSLFVAGWLLTGMTAVNFNDTWSLVGQSPAGLVTLVTGQVGKGVLAAKTSAEFLVPESYRSGSVYTLAAGLLNLLVVLDAYLVANGIHRPTRQRQTGELPDATKEGAENG